MTSREEKSRALLSDILPRKGKKSYDQFVTIVRETEGQKDVAEVLGKRTGNEEAIFVINFWKLSGRETRSSAAGEEENKQLKRKVAELEKKRAKSELTNIGLRNKVILCG